jgi:3-phytase
VLTEGVNGQPRAQLVRRAEIGSISEGCAADEATDALYITEENVGVWRYRLDPASGAERTLVQAVAPGVLVADAEGLTIIEDGSARYLIGSSQGDSTFPVWRVDGAAAEYKGRFKVTEGAVDAITGTDGLDAHGGAVGSFPEGVVVIQDDVNDAAAQNFKYVDWRDIRAALGL